MSEIQKVYDENQDEYVIVVGGIKDDKITARPLVFVDPYPTISQESRDFGKSLRTAYDFSFMVRLYRSGRAYVIGGDVPENQISQVEKSVPGLYDELWPDIAQKMQRFERDVIVSLNQRMAEFSPQSVKAAIEKKKDGRPFLTLLQAVEQEYLADGEIDARLGWMISGEPSPLLRCLIPYEKYRWSRSVSDVARKLNADALIFISEGFVMSKTEPYERTGQLTLIGQFILSNGSVAQSVSGIYEVVNNRLRVVQPLQEPKEQRQQNFFPPWA